MRKTIFKGMHRPLFQIPAFLCPIGHLEDDEELTLHKVVSFNSNCAYNLNNSKQRDWNKLFGVCFGLRGIHKNSVRFGWRYREDLELIELCVIIYREGRQPLRREVAQVPLNIDTNLEISILRKSNTYEVFFRVFNTCVYDIILECDSPYYYGCGFYFGGKSVAPHKMSINIKRVK